MVIIMASNLNLNSLHKLGASKVANACSEIFFGKKTSWPKR